MVTSLISRSPSCLVSVEAPSMLEGRPFSSLGHMISRRYALEYLEMVESSWVSSCEAAFLCCSSPEYSAGSSKMERTTNATDTWQDTFHIKFERITAEYSGELCEECQCLTRSRQDNSFEVRCWKVTESKWDLSTISRYSRAYGVWCIVSKCTLAAIWLPKRISWLFLHTHVTSAVRVLRLNQTGRWAWDKWSDHTFNVTFPLVLRSWTSFSRSWLEIQGIPSTRLTVPAIFNLRLYTCTYVCMVLRG